MTMIENIKRFIWIVLDKCPYKKTIKILKIICLLLPINKRKIVFCNFNGKGFGDNPKYICQEILRQDLDYELIWLTSNTVNMPKGIKVVPFYSIHAIYALSTAKVIINNVKNGLPYIKRSNQYYIQTWHGTNILKYVEEECQEKLSRQYIINSMNDSKITNLMLTSNRFDYNIMRKSFWYSGEFLKKGMPRNDIYFNNTKKEIDAIADKLLLPKDVKKVIYAPTFRDDGNTECYDLDSMSLLKTLEEKFGGKWILLLRFHPNVNNNMISMRIEPNVVNVSSYPDPQELVVISDLLITDYSSVSIDATLNKTPVILYASDLSNYNKMRGVRPIYYDLPFPFCQSNEDVRSAIYDFNQDDYWKRVNDFMNRTIVSYDDGHASENVVERIKNIME